MTTIYVVTDGDYSDYGIKGIASTLEKAEELKKLFNAHNKIEEYELDEYDPAIEESKGKTFYFTALAIEDGRVLDIKSTTYRKFENQDIWDKPTQIWDNRCRFKTPTIINYLFAKDEAHAIKIANEKRIAYKAEKIT